MYVGHFLNLWNIFVCLSVYVWQHTIVLLSRCGFKAHWQLLGTDIMWLKNLCPPFTHNNKTTPYNHKMQISSQIFTLYFFKSLYAVISEKYALSLFWQNLHKVHILFIRYCFVVVTHCCPWITAVTIPYEAQFWSCSTYNHIILDLLLKSSPPPLSSQCRRFKLRFPLATQLTSLHCQLYSYSIHLQLIFPYDNTFYCSCQVMKYEVVNVPNKVT